MPPRRSTTKGFKHTASLLTQRIRAGAESRGFAESRLLTRWDEIAGADIAAIARPVNVSYGRGGMGATLTLLTTGAQAPMLEMQKDTLRARVNSTYGYNAISRIRITQTAPTGFSEGQAQFQRQASKGPTAPGPNAVAAGDSAAQHIDNPELREAIARLGANIHARTPSKET
ncbi:MAG: DciA family protein [Pseudomonadota bacterium]